MMDRERIHKYTKEEVLDTLRDNDMTMGDANYLAAIRIPTGVTQVLGRVTTQELPTVSLRLFYIPEGQTGYFHPLGRYRILFINDKDMVDYDLVSELHTTAAADAYLALTEPWEAGRDATFELIGEWYRDETYLDHFKGDK